MQYHIVAVNERIASGISETMLNFGRFCADQFSTLLGRIRGEAETQLIARLIAQPHRIPIFKTALDPHHASGQQVFTLPQSPRRAGIDHNLSPGGQRG